MRHSPSEHRVRGRVWLALSLLTGAGAVYVHDAAGARGDERDLLRAARVSLQSEPKVLSYGGGPSVAAPYIVEEERAAPSESREEEASSVVAMTAAADAMVEEVVVDAVAPGDASLDAAVEDAAPPEQDAAPEDAGPAMTAAARDGGVLYDPNAPYVTPIYALPVPPGAASPVPAPVGAGGTATVPGADMAGGTTIGAAGAGGTTIGTAGAGGTSIGVTGAGGTSIGVSGAGGTAVGPGAPVNPFAAQGVVESPPGFGAVPFVYPYGYFFLVPPGGAFGGVPPTR